MPEPIHPALIDTAKYKELLFRAVYEVFQPMGVTESDLRNWVFGNASYLQPPGVFHKASGMPLFAKQRHVRVDVL
jgi:hypothetical protein